MLTLALAIALAQSPLPSWKEIDALENQQKLEAASQAAKKRLDAAQKGSDEMEQARALIKVTQLRLALGGYETAVKELKAQKWPKGPVPGSAVELFYAEALWQYAYRYGYEIRQREKVDTKGVVDLKAWTAEQIYAEAAKAYEKVWAQREELGKHPVSDLGPWITPNDYPKGVRSTLRDAVSYLWAAALANSTSWTADQSAELYKLDAAALTSPGAAGRWNPADASRHPLERMAAVLDDLETFHTRQGEREGALEAYRSRLEKLWQNLTDEDVRDRLRAALTGKLESAKGLPWSAMLRFTLASWIHEQGDWAKARQVADQGAREFPQSVGGKRCRFLVAQIEAPEFTVQTMQSDAAGRRSIRLEARNLKELYFRAYKLDLHRALEEQRNWGLLPNNDQMRALLGRTPDAKWTQALPATPDYQLHATYVVPPMKDHALWVVIASARADFADQSNRLQGVNLLLTRLGLLVRQGDGRLAAQVLDADTGAPVPGAEVELWSQRWTDRYQLKKEDVRKTGADGEAVFESAGRPTDRTFFVIAHQGIDDAIDTQNVGFYGGAPSARTASLTFTDRSVYRPQQKLFFQVLGYSADASGTELKPAAELGLSVELLDPNYQVVDKRTVRTNAFGTASGEFLVPSGRLLGAWSIRVKDEKNGHSSQSFVRVEEYKRPTFEVGWKDTGQVVRLNAPAVFTGEAKYYFGLPVSSGQVHFRVQRTPVWPWWWGWWGWKPSGGGVRTVAAGATAVKADGTFEIRFTPEADAKLSKDVSYSYELEADVTDEGGETRSASKTVRVGFVSVQGSVAFDREVLREGEGLTATARRSDLDGNPRAGRGSWKLFALVQPDHALLPADEPMPGPPPDKAGAYRTEGDQLRARWSGWGSWQATVRQWKTGQQVGQGELTHDDKGVAKLDAGKLKAGAYRLVYETKDEAGQVATAQYDVLVAGRGLGLKLPGLLEAAETTLKVGQTLTLVAGSGFSDQPYFVEYYRAGRLLSRELHDSKKAGAFIERPITAADRGGFQVELVTVKDHQLIHLSRAIQVPWDDKTLDLEFSTFRDTLRPGAKETFRVTVKSHGQPVGANAAEVLAYMYDKSLDVFAPHNPPSIPALYPSRASAPWLRSAFVAENAQWLSTREWYSMPDYPNLREDQLLFISGYGIGGPGRRGGKMMKSLAYRDDAPAAEPAAPPPAQAEDRSRGDTDALGGFGGVEKKEEVAKRKAKPDTGASSSEAESSSASTPLRQQFAETAFFKPNLLTDAKGQVAIEFTVPDSVTAYNVWAHALTRQMAGGSVHQETRAVKELMVRPYVPRFLREGDQATVKVLVNNASAKDLSGQLTLDVIDPETEKSVAAELKVSPAAPQAFTVKPNQSATLTFQVVAPARVGLVAFKVIAKAGDLSDGELRPVPLLPSRLHLAQSRFITLKGDAKRTITFADLAKGGDPTLINEQLTVTVDAQLFFTVLKALPYLQRYPYECTEQTLNRFLSAGIVGSVFRDSPQVAKMASKFAARKTPLEPFDAVDPNRKMMLEESPWLLEAKGGNDPRRDAEFIDMLDPKVVAGERASALLKLQKAQQSSGAFPWFPGGPPSPYMTLYLVQGFARAAEFKVDVPKDMVQRAWRYLAQEYRGDWATCMAHDGCWEWITTLNFAASSFPDDSWLGGALSKEEREQMLSFSFRHWKQHSPLLKGYLALTLKRAGRGADAKLVFDSVMDSSKTTADEGTFWQPEDRAWLWYNDTIETHAFALRTLTELDPKDPRREGLVQWLLLNKKLNQWKSTRATAEVIYALTKYLSSEHQLSQADAVKVEVGPLTQQLVFSPDEYSGKQQVVVPGDKVTPAYANVTVSKKTKSIDFVSATWMFSTEKLPKEERGDFFHVTRTYFKRVQQGKQMVLQPLADGAKLEPGDELEVQLSIRAKQAAEYVHLRDPRGAGFEPENPVSRWRWDLGLAWYEEFRDSATNFFFESLPAGEYTLKYRVRAAMGGVFRVGPATLDSMYAPEFTAYSAGTALNVSTGGK